METIASSGDILPTPKEKSGYKYFYYFAYYPTRFEVSEEFQKRRKIIWNFKDGYFSKKIANTLKEDIDHLNLTKPYSEWWLCIIPASTVEKTETRFKEFCESYCNGTQINNGYTLIKSKENREAKHLTEDRDSIDILDTMEFGDFDGKRVLLFDDIYTTGKSFTKVARRLSSLNATDVVGLFLGKTHWLEESSSIEDYDGPLS